MRKRFHDYAKLFWGIFATMWLIVGGLIFWQINNRRPLSSSFESVWARLGTPRIRAVDQATIDFATVYKVMKHYACREFEKFFEYKMSIPNPRPHGVQQGRGRLSDIERRALQQGRNKLSDVDCTSAVLVSGYSEPPLRWARFIGITLLPDKEAKQLAHLHDTYGDTISPEEKAIWKRVAFIVVLLGKHTLLTVWYHDGNRWWLVTFMDVEEVKQDLGIR